MKKAASYLPAGNKNAALALIFDFLVHIMLVRWSKTLIFQYVQKLRYLTSAFVVPGEWTKQEADAETLGIFQVQFTSQKQAGNAFRYGSADLWEAATASERSGHTRADFNSAYFYTYLDGAYVEYMAESLIQGASEGGGNAEVESIQLVTYGSNECIEFLASLEMFGIRSPIIVIIHIENGYMYEFTFFGTSSNAAIDFQPIIKSLQVPPTEGSGSNDTASGQPDELSEKIMEHLVNFLLFLFELVVTFLIYALPFVIYRHAIRKRPVGKKVLLIIIIVLYEFVVWVLLNTAMSLFLRSYANIFIPFIWGWFSYRKMVRGKDSDDLPEDAGGSAAPQQPIKAAPPSTSTAYIPTASTSAAPAPQVPPASPHLPAAPAPQVPPASPHLPAAPAPQVPPAAPRIRFCRNCGFRLLDDSKFCSACGTPVILIAKE